MKYLPGLSHDIKPLSCSTRNRVNLLLKGQHGIKRHPRYKKISTVPSRVNGVDWGWTVLDLETIIVLVLLAFSLIPHRSHHTLTLFRSRFINSNSNSFTRGWHNSYQSGVVSITVKLVFHCREKLRGVQEEQLRTQNTSLRHS